VIIWEILSAKNSLQALSYGFSVAVFGITAAFGQETPDANIPPIWGFSFENDWFDGDDKNYTAGWQLSRSRRVQNHTAFHRWSLRASAKDTVVKQHSLGQQIFTAETDDTPIPPPDEHPYAAHLFADLTYGIARPGTNYTDQFSIQLGLTGDGALGEFVQDTAHDVVGGARFQGWDSQIGTQPTLQLAAERRWTTWKRQVGSRDFEFATSIGLTGGNALVAGEIGATLRTGRDLRPTFGEPKLLPAIGGLAWHDRSLGTPKGYGFIGITARGIAHKIWVDGRLWESDDFTQDSNSFVYDVNVGYVLPIKFLKGQLSFTYVFRSETFENQTGPTTFGRLGVQKSF